MNVGVTGLVQCLFDLVDGGKDFPVNKIRRRIQSFLPESLHSFTYLGSWTLRCQPSRNCSLEGIKISLQCSIMASTSQLGNWVWLLMKAVVLSSLKYTVCRSSFTGIPCIASRKSKTIQYNVFICISSCVQALRVISFKCNCFFTSSDIIHHY